MLSRDEIQIANKNMKTFNLTSHQKKMKIKTILKFNLTQVRIAIIKKIRNVDKMWM